MHSSLVSLVTILLAALASGAALPEHDKHSSVCGQCFESPDACFSACRPTGGKCAMRAGALSVCPSCYCPGQPLPWWGPLPTTTPKATPTPTPTPKPHRPLPGACGTHYLNINDCNKACGNIGSSCKITAGFSVSYECFCDN